VFYNCWNDAGGEGKIDYGPPQHCIKCNLQKAIQVRLKFLPSYLRLGDYYSPINDFFIIIVEAEDEPSTKPSSMVIKNELQLIIHSSWPNGGLNGIIL
jgi:hypothetical protein